MNFKKGDKFLIKNQAGDLRFSLPDRFKGTVHFVEDVDTEMNTIYFRCGIKLNWAISIHDIEDPAIVNSPLWKALS